MHFLVNLLGRLSLWMTMSMWRMTSAASAGDASRMADSSAMMSICDAVHLVLIKTEPAGETHLVSSHYLEWRPVLAAPGCRCTMSIEMMGIGECDVVSMSIEMMASVSVTSSACR